MRKDQPGYQQWYERHLFMERIRKANIAIKKNPVVVLDDDQRGELPDTCPLAELYYHPSDCNCGPCQSPMKGEIKKIHALTKPRPRTIRSLNPVPQLPRPLLLRLQAVEAEVLSRVDTRP